MFWGLDKLFGKKRSNKDITRDWLVADASTASSFLRELSDELDDGEVKSNIDQARGRLNGLYQHLTKGEDVQAKEKCQSTLSLLEKITNFEHNKLTDVKDCLTRLINKL
jgi:hypothetical protein